MRLPARIWYTLASLIATAPMLSAWYTICDAGEDLSAAGHGIEQAADTNTRS
jgi:predicted small secreted protein